MSPNIPSSSLSLAHQSQGLPYTNGDAPQPSDPNDGRGVLENSRDNSRYTSVTISVPNEIQYMTEVIKSILDQLDPMERLHLRLIITLVCVETAFLKSIGQTNKEVLRAILLTGFFGFASHVWSKLKRVQCMLDDVVGKVDILQNTIKSLESTATPHPPVEHVPKPAGAHDSTFLTRDDPTLKSFDLGPEGPDEHLATGHVNPSAVAVNCATPVPPTFPGSYNGGGVTLEGMDDAVVSDFGMDPVKAPLVIENLPSPVPTTPSWPDRGVTVTLEGMGDNIIGLSDVGLASSSAERPRPTPELAFSHWLPTLREIKQRIEQFTEGRFERTLYLDQSEPSNRVQLRRCAVLLLMTGASFSPADFTSPVGFLGPSESTPYYPTGDLQDRTIAFTIAMECLDHLEVHLHGNDVIRITTTLFDLTQALSDLGLHKYALDTSGFALDTLKHPYVATPEDFRHRVASVLSLQASILCNLKQNDEAVDAAHRAVALFREHRDSQTTPVPELTFASLNYAVLLNSIGLKDECAAVVFELLGEVDESQPDMKDVSTLCNLCLSNMRFDAEGGMDLSTTEETIELTRTSSDAISQMALAGALLNKSKILSSKGQNGTAISFSAEAVTLLRGMSATRPVFSLFLAHAVDNHARIHLEANYKRESHSIRHDAVELWQRLKVSAPDPFARPLAWSLFELSKFRHEGGERNVLREELRIAESAVDAFRGVVPPDIPGLADALYLFAVRMLEQDKNREAATYAEESVQYFREASAEDPKYALDLIFSLSLASSCLAYTERDEDAFEYAKQAVEVQHGRKGVEEKQYDAHLRLLLMDVVTRSMEMDKVHEALPWLQELKALDPSIVEKSWNPLLRRSGMSQDNREEFRKQTTYWMNPNTDAQRPNNSSASSTPVASSSSLKVDKGKGKELAPSPEARSFITQDVKGKAKEVNPMVDLRIPGHSPPADEEIFSPGAATQRTSADIGNMMGPLQEGIVHGGSGSNDHFNGMLGGRTLGGLGTSGLGTGGLGISGGMDNLGLSGHAESIRSLRDMVGLGGSVLTESLLGNLGRLSPDFFRQGNGYGAGSHNNEDRKNGGSGAQGGASSQPSSTTRTGTWSGMGIQSRLADEADEGA